MNRPLNVDIHCDLRSHGHSHATFTFDSDEGDGYSLTYNHTKNDPYQPNLKPHHFEEWINHYCPLCIKKPMPSTLRYIIEIEINSQKLQLHCNRTLLSKILSNHKPS